jgi:hypothetical protein
MSGIRLFSRNTAGRPPTSVSLPGCARSSATYWRLSRPGSSRDTGTRNSRCPSQVDPAPAALANPSRACPRERGRPASARRECPAGRSAVQVQHLTPAADRPSWFNSVAQHHHRHRDATTMASNSQALARPMTSVTRSIRARQCSECAGSPVSSVEEHDVQHHAGRTTRSPPRRCCGTPESSRRGCARGSDTADTRTGPGQSARPRWYQAP